MDCSACGRNLDIKYLDPQSHQMIEGIVPTMELCLHTGPVPVEVVEKVYHKVKLNHHYNICMECALKNLGVSLEERQVSVAGGGIQEGAGRVDEGKGA